MKRLTEFLNSNIVESEDQDIYSLYYDDGTMYTYYTTEAEANEEAEKLNKENSDFKVTVKKEKKSDVEKTVTEGSSDNKLWDQLDKLKDALGAEKVLDELCQAMDDDKMKEYIEFIATNWDVKI